MRIPISFGKENSRPREAKMKISSKSSKPWIVLASMILVAALTSCSSEPDKAGDVNSDGDVSFAECMVSLSTEPGSLEEKSSFCEMLSSGS
jgi:hypothetical protein